MDIELQPRTSLARAVSFTFDESSGVISGRDAATVEKMLSEAQKQGYASSEVQGFNYYNLEFPPTLTTIGAVLESWWYVEGVLPTPEVEQDEFPPEWAHAVRL